MEDKPDLTVDKGGWLTQRSGAKFDLDNIEKNTYYIEDIAHSLAMQVRWNGHIENINNHFSVAQHSVYVSRRVSLPESRLWALMHDASESIVCDVPKPLKPYLTGYTELENKIQDAIVDSFNIPINDEILADVHLADFDLAFMEMRSLLKPPVEPFYNQEYAVKDDLTWFKNYACWTANEAKTIFLLEYQKIVEELS